MSAIAAEIAAVADLRLLAAALATLVAGVMRGYAGFGTAVLLAPIYSTLWGPLAGVPVMLLLELAVSAQLLPRSWREADRPLILPIGITACLATPLGAWLLVAAEPEALRRFMGGFVLVFGLLLLSPWRYHGPRPLPLNMGVGLVAGILKGATGISGPPVILYLLSGPDEARRHRANLILFFGLIAVVSIVMPIALGLITWAVLLKLVVMVPVMTAGILLGARLFGILPVRFYRPFALLSLVSAGLLALLA
ncbi:MAG: sulfite exporter TauE/SafE family protein [Acetobacteraceae bacterium]|nr:sulfite exporter TauE/SafE family protein [Acetobacteraceae bacterium]